jgi:HPt (histidine-containing phosphotransfer) domain-containing protein
MREDVEQTLAAGCDHHLAKPLRRADLIEVLNRYVGTLHPSTPEPRRPPPPHPARSAIDQTILAQLKDETGRGFGRILEMFLKNLPGRLEALRTASENRDSDTLRQIAHKLKGTSSTFGAQNFANLCAELEQLAIRNTGPATLQDTLNKVRHEGDQVQRYLSAALNELHLP